MALQHNPGSLASNLNSTSLPRSLSPSPPRFSHGVLKISVGPLLSASDQVANSSSLSPSASGIQILSPECFLPDQFSRGYMRPTGDEGSTSSFVHLPGTLGLGSPRFSHVAPPLFVSEQADSSSLSLSSPRGQIFLPHLPTQTTIGHEFMVSPPRGNSSARAFFDEATRDPVHVAGPEKMTRRASDGDAVAGYPGFGIPDASKVAAQLDAVHVAAPRVGNTRPVGPAAGPSRSAISCISGPVTKEGLGSLVSSSGPVGPIIRGPIIRARSSINLSQATSSTLRQLPATSGTDKKKSPAILAPSSPTQSQGDASRVLQAHVAGPSRSAVHFVSRPVINLGTNGLFHGLEGPVYQGPLSPSVNTVQSANAASSSVVVNILTMLSQTQIEQEEKINNVSNDNFNLSRDLILLKHEANRRIDIVDKAAWNEINAVNWRAKALAAQRDRTKQIFLLVIAERDEKFDKLVTGLNDLKEEREKEEAKEAKKEEKSRKFWNYTLIGFGGALLVGVSVAAAILGVNSN